MRDSYFCQSELSQICIFPQKQHFKWSQKIKKAINISVGASLENHLFYNELV
jgi:hypothetical protein